MAQNTVKIETLVDSKLEGSIPFSFGITLGDKLRRKLLADSGMNREEVITEMSTLGHKVNGLFNFTGMSGKTFVEKYGLQRMAVEARTGLYKAAEGVSTLEGFDNADKALAEYLKDDEIEFLHDSLAVSPWHIPGRKKLTTFERMERSVAKVENVDDLEALQNAIAAEIALRKNA